MSSGRQPGGEAVPALGTLSEDIFERAATLKRAGRPFVLATVVWSQRPTSARPGARGIVSEDGSLFGWVGGSCAQPTVVREALAALEDGEARILRLSPDATGEESRPGVVVAPMTCHSGGTLEIFLEPFRPPLRLLVVGESPVADALVRLGHVLGYRVIAVRPGAAGTAPPEAYEVRDTLDLASGGAGGQAAAVAATMGLYDEDAVEHALQAGIGYVALVASRRRADSVTAFLQASGVSDELLARVKAPAGLDIAAEAPEEIALSILAEIIACRRSLPVLGLAAIEEPRTALDPVCGMTVEIAGARHTFEHRGERYYFCCPACRREFAANPAAYLPSA